MWHLHSRDSTPGTAECHETPVGLLADSPYLSTLLGERKVRRRRFLRSPMAELDTVQSVLRGRIDHGPKDLFPLMKTLRRVWVGLLLLVTAPVLTGCWSPPVATTVRPSGESRLIQRDIIVESVKPPATVVSIDPNAHWITILSRGRGVPVSYRVSPAVRNLNRFQVGDRVRPRVAEQLTVFAVGDGQAPPLGTDGSAPNVDARILSVDRSYRLLTLRFPNEPDETLKVNMGVKLDEMKPGDAVSVTSAEAVALRRKR